MRLEDIDKNFKIETKLDLPGLKFYDARLEPFKTYGVFYEDGQYRRLPESVAKTVNEGVETLARHTAGGRIKFKTDSSYIAIHSKSARHHMPHCALSGSSGFDIYIGKNENYKGTIIPPAAEYSEFEGKRDLGERKMREITVNFPLYTTVYELYIGLEEDARIEDTSGYKYDKPIVYYGSSITQGGCASRPGNSYQGFISRALGANYINLGFSGSARGEDTIAEYVSKLDMSVFVYDYDHNAPSTEHLEATHEKMFKAVREKQPTLPIVILPRPAYHLFPDEVKRDHIVRKTYENAIAGGDENVYYISGRELMKFARNEGTVDGCHPNDLGFFSMAKAIIPILKTILNKQ